MLALYALLGVSLSSPCLKEFVTLLNIHKRQPNPLNEDRDVCKTRERERKKKRYCIPWPQP